MEGDLHVFISAVFFGLFAIVNPVGTVPVYLGLVKNYDDATRKMVAKTASFVAFGVVVLFVALGKVIFETFGITLPAFQITGGLLVFKVGIDMMTSDGSDKSEGEPQTNNALQKARNLAISPLAVPLLAGPGTIATAMNFAGIYSGWKYLLGIAGIAAVVFLITYILFLSAEKVQKFIGDNLLVVFSKLMGLIIAVMGIQLVISGTVAVVNNQGWFQ